MFSKEEQKLVIDEYCFNAGITDEVIKASIVIGHLGQNGDYNNSFTVERLVNKESTTTARSMYVLEKTDLDYISNQKCLHIEKRFGNMNKSQIITWVRQQVNVHLLESDMDHIVTDNKAFTIIISADSMRFKNSFKLYRV